MYRTTFGTTILYYVPESFINYNVLARNLDAGNPMLVANTISLLDLRNRSEYADSVMRHLNNPNQSVWVVSAQFLGKQHREVAIPYLIRILSTDLHGESPVAQNHLVEMTGEEFGTNITAWLTWLVSEDDLIKSYLGSSDHMVVANTIGMLDYVGDTNYAGSIRNYLERPEPNVWVTAAMYMGRLRQSNAVPYLVEILNTPFSSLHESTIQMLYRITGHRFINYEQWRAWLETQDTWPVVIKDTRHDTAVGY